MLQVPFSRRAVTVPQGGRALLRCGIALAATCLLLTATPGLPVVAAVVVLLVVGFVECLGEIEEAAGGWAVSLGLAPAATRGRYLGVWALGFAVHDIAGPTIMALLVADGGVAGLVLLAAVFLVAGVLAQRLSAGVGLEPPRERLGAVHGRVDDRDPAAGQP